MNGPKWQTHILKRTLKARRRIDLCSQVSYQDWSTLRKARKRRGTLMRLPALDKNEEVNCFRVAQSEETRSHFPIFKKNDPTLCDRAKCPAKPKAYKEGGADINPWY